MNKINEYFDKDEYVVFFGHDMPQVGYSYVEDYDEEVGTKTEYEHYKEVLNW